MTDEIPQPGSPEWDQAGLDCYLSAIGFFRGEHRGQTDLQGRDYFTHHLLPVAQVLIGVSARAAIAGLGHDWIEDVWKPEPIDADVEAGTRRLLHAGLPQESVAAIGIVTRRGGEAYVDFITRVIASGNLLAIEVKLADNLVNLSAIPSLAPLDQAKAERLLDRYLDARDRLVVARAGL